MVAVNLEEEEYGLPYGLAKVLCVEGQSLVVHWWGTRRDGRRGRWFPLQKKGTSRAYTQEIDRSVVLASGICLTTAKHIPLPTHRLVMEKGGVEMVD